MDDAAAVQAALEAYNLLPPIRVTSLGDTTNNQSFLVQTPNERLRCKLFTPIHPPEALRYELRLLEDLAALPCSFAVPAPRRMRDGAALCTSALGYLVLLPDLPGALLDPTDPGQVESLGAALGELHNALDSLPQTPRPGHALFSAMFRFPPPEWNPLQLEPAMIGAPETPEAYERCAWWRATAAALDAFVQGAYRRLPARLCHNDATPYNVLVQDRRVSAVLDFEFAGLAPRAFDFAMTLRMTMRVWENPDPWESARRLCRGYRRRARLDADSCTVLPQLILLRSTMGILWALGRNEAIPSERFMLHLDYLRNAECWLAQHGDRLASLVAQACG
jgi:Ser/Thr protein kinase RdoA (MazF antagonist)